MNPPTVIQNDDGKHLATLTAQLALRGFSVYEVVGGGYFVGHWSMTRYCPQLADLDAFARQVGATR